MLSFYRKDHIAERPPYAMYTLRDMLLRIAHCFLYSFMKNVKRNYTVQV